MLMSTKELMCIIRVVASLEAVSMLEVNIVDIIISFDKWRLIDKNEYFSLLRKFSSQDIFMSVESRVRRFYSFMETILPLVCFEHFVRMLKAAGQFKLANAIVAEQNGATHSCPVKRQLPHGDVVNKYFANLKSCADNNLFQDGTKFQLEEMIRSLSNKLKHLEFDVSPEKCQILVEKRVMTYFLLAQQFSKMNERESVMVRMRDSVPSEADMTLFNVIFHSYMSVICALNGDVTLAENHERQARFASHLCLPDIAGVVLRLCIQYKNNVFFFKRHRRDDLEHAKSDFEEIFQMFDSMSNNTQIYGTIAKLEMVHTLLGIDWDLHVCEIFRIKPCDIERGQKIMSTLDEPSEARREMLFCLCRARLSENADPAGAKSLAQKALSLADDGSYYEIEKKNIKRYLKTLDVQDIPSAQVYPPTCKV